MEQTCSELFSVDPCMRYSSNRRNDSEIVSVKMLKGMLLVFCFRFSGNCMFKAAPDGFIEIRVMQKSTQKVFSKTIAPKLCIKYVQGIEYC